MNEDSLSNCPLGRGSRQAVRCNWRAFPLHSAPFICCPRVIRQLPRPTRRPTPTMHCGLPCFVSFPPLSHLLSFFSPLTSRKVIFPLTLSACGRVNLSRPAFCLPLIHFLACLVQEALFARFVRRDTGPCCHTRRVVVRFGHCSFRRLHIPSDHPFLPILTLISFGPLWPALLRGLPSSPAKHAMHKCASTPLCRQMGNLASPAPVANLVQHTLLLALHSDRVRSCLRLRLPRPRNALLQMLPTPFSKTAHFCL
ncbi:unnamed protein product [Protopolystoma xenopodis]|uniref:Uncharacterized protein n=1 Tax=Protopolystoma xenopodis TaxID=117903 RepID=A0A3S5AZF8_9PLAT|nr:unnamed protein product [Protopolystoma xenopodis]